MGDIVDILLVRSEQQTVAVIAPATKAKVGDLVQYAGGCVGRVIDSVKWQEQNGPLQGFIARIIDIFEAEAVFNLGYAKEETTNGD